MAKIHIVFGPQGAGKSTYSRQLADRVAAVRFSIDDWMGQLFGPDMPKPMDIGWIIQRVRRCEQRIWATALDVASRGSDVVLDLGFMKVANRTEFLGLAAANALPAQLHWVDAPLAIRRQRVHERNQQKSETFSFEVTPAMFDFMEQQFEPATAHELETCEERH